MGKDSDGVPARRLSTPARWLLGGVGLASLGLGVAWIERRTIAADVIDRRLAQAGVPARYTVADLGFGRQRLTNVVIGDPRAPDLVADWLETGTKLSWSGASVTALRGGHVRLRARLVDGRVSLGGIDRLLPPPSGKPFAPPRLFLDVADLRLRLETPAGLVGVKVAGRGRLDDGFDGRVAAVSERLVSHGCVARGVTAALRVSIRRAAPTAQGPVRAAALDCGESGARSVRIGLHARLSPALDRWRGNAQVAAAHPHAPGAAAERIGGGLRFDGTAAATSGRLDLALDGARGRGWSAARTQAAGAYRIGERTGFDGDLRARGVRVATEAIAIGEAGAGTPVAPLARALDAAIARAGRDLAFDARIAATGAGAVRVSRLDARARSGARLLLAGGDGVTWTGAGIRLDGGLDIGGGGLPRASISLDQPRPGAPIGGRAMIAPYAARGARLALSPVAFSATPGGATRVETRVTLSGPLGDGRVDDFAMPVEALWNGLDRFIVNPGCTPLSWRRLAVSGLALDPARLRLCPTGPALVSVVDGRVSGGARLAAARLDGRLGSSPVSVAAAGATLSLDDRGFALTDVAACLGRPDRVTRINAARLDGRLTNGSVAGRFEGAGGRIANVPLLLGGAAGEWRLANGALALSGGGAVTDAQTPARFEPMASDDLRLTLRNSRIDVAGTLRQQALGVKVADLRIAHDLRAGAGEALLDVPGVTFGERLQPEQLTRLTFGVVANVAGTVRGRGRIAWSPDGVASTGVFGTDGLDLAAAFGPVTGIRTEIRFRDLLALESEPGQVATVKSVNPGIAVENGVVLYQTLAGSRVRVEGARWPFAGGVLTLEPTLLDFSRPTERRLTFRLAGVRADQFLTQFDFANLNATGVFDGTVPMIFDERGGRIEDGWLQVRPGGGTLAYVGELSKRNLGFWGDLAFQSLKSLRYRDLSIEMNGPLAGEMVTEVRFAGVSQGEGAKSNFLIRRLTRLPLVFNIRIRAPFRGLIDSARGFYDPKLLLRQRLPELLAQPPVQLPASENKP